MTSVEEPKVGAALAVEEDENIQVDFSLTKKKKKKKQKNAKNPSAVAAPN